MTRATKARDPGGGARAGPLLRVLYALLDHPVLLFSVPAALLAVSVVLVVALPRRSGERASAPAPRSTASRPSALPEASRPTSAPASRVAEVLSALQRSDPGQRSATLQDIPAEDLAAVQEEVLRILDDPARASLVAVDAAGAWRLQPALASLQHLARWGAPAIRAAAIRSADAIEAWRLADLSEFLADEESVVLTATLELCAKRDERPRVRILDLLESGSPEVRAAAAAAVPSLRNEPALARRLCVFARIAPGEALVAVVDALRNAGVEGDVEACLTELAMRTDEQARCAALDALASKGKPLATPAPILALARDPNALAMHRCRALLALERTSSVSPEPVRQIAAMAPPMVRLHAVRALVVAGDASATAFLIDFLRSEPEVGVLEDEVAATIRAAHDLLVEIAGVDHGRDIGAWTRWQRSFAQDLPRTLKAAPPERW